MSCLVCGACPPLGGSAPPLCGLCVSGARVLWPHLLLLASKARAGCLSLLRRWCLILLCLSLPPAVVWLPGAPRASTPLCARPAPLPSSFTPRLLALAVPLLPADQPRWCRPSLPPALGLVSWSSQVARVRLAWSRRLPPLRVSAALGPDRGRRLPSLPGLGFRLSCLGCLPRSFRRRGVRGCAQVAVCGHRASGSFRLKFPCFSLYFFVQSPCLFASFCPVSGRKKKKKRDKKAKNYLTKVLYICNSFTYI